MENAPNKFHRLKPGGEVRLRYGYIVKCESVVKNERGEILEVHCTYDPETRGGDAPDGRKPKATLHWVAAEHAVPAVVRLSHLKCRHGAQRTVDLHFDRARQAFTLLSDAVDARPAPTPAPGKRGRKPQRATPDPAFSPERLAELWKSTPAAPADAVAADDDGGDK